MAKNPNCDICRAIEDKTSLMIYKDDEIVAMLDENPASFGQIVVLPKDHFTIIEQVPDYIVSKIFQVVNKLSVVAFESLGIEGTNILIQNGVAGGQGLPHFMVNIIPRVDGDGINLIWQPKQLTEEEMSTVELVLKEQAQTIGNFQYKKDEEEFEEEQPEVISSSESSHIFSKSEKNEGSHQDTSGNINEGHISKKEEENYLVKHLTRIA